MPDQKISQLPVATTLKLIEVVNDSDISSRMTLSALQNIIGGGIGAVESSTKTNTFSTTSTSFVDVPGLSVVIATPVSTSSEFLVFGNVNMGGPTGAGVHVRLVRDSTPIAVGDAAGSRVRGSSQGQASSSDEQENLAFHTKDSPATISSITYKIQIRSSTGLSTVINRASNDPDALGVARTASAITAMEIL